MRPRPMKATFTTNLRSSISSDRRVTVITYNRAANGPKNRPFAPPDVPQPRPGNLEIRNCGDHQVETCQIACGFGHDVENQPASQYNRSEERSVGQECDSTCKSRWTTSHEKKKRK